MALQNTSLKNRFHLDFHGLGRINQEFPLIVNGHEFDIEVCEVSDHIIGGKALAFYLPDETDFVVTIEEIINNHEKFIRNFLTTVVIGTGRADRNQGLESTYFRFSGVIYVYCEGEVTDQQIKELWEKAYAQKIQLIVRDLEYQRQDNLWENPFAFISHDSSDKDRIAKPLSHELMSARCPVWYDEYSLEIGDNIRVSIEDGIKKCKKCIVIISQEYISNTRWAIKEFESIVAREIIKNESVILPVWYNVTPEDVYEFSPSLSNIKGIIWKDDAHNVAWQLKRVIELRSKS